jgi:hypothetical protein
LKYLSTRSGSAFDKRTTDTVYICEAAAAAFDFLQVSEWDKPDAGAAVTHVATRSIFTPQVGSTMAPVNVIRPLAAPIASLAALIRGMHSIPTTATLIHNLLADPFISPLTAPRSDYRAPECYRYHEPDLESGIDFVRMRAQKPRGASHFYGDWRYCSS